MQGYFWQNAHGPPPFIQLKDFSLALQRACSAPHNPLNHNNDTVVNNNHRLLQLRS